MDRNATATRALVLLGLLGSAGLLVLVYSNWNENVMAENTLKEEQPSRLNSEQNYSGPGEVAEKADKPPDQDTKPVDTGRSLQSEASKLQPGELKGQRVDSNKPEQEDTEQEDDNAGSDSEETDQSKQSGDGSASGDSNNSSEANDNSQASADGSGDDNGSQAHEENKNDHEPPVKDERNQKINEAVLENRMLKDGPADSETDLGQNPDSANGQAQSRLTLCKIYRCFEASRAFRRQRYPSPRTGVCWSLSPP